MAYNWLRRHATTHQIPVIRIHPIGIGSSAFDASGWAWLTYTVIAVIIVLLITR
jgi:hypothetical protein